MWCRASGAQLRDLSSPTSTNYYCLHILPDPGLGRHIIPLFSGDCPQSRQEGYHRPYPVHPRPPPNA
jgi:hypothetical protein